MTSSLTVTIDVAIAWATEMCREARSSKITPEHLVVTCMKDQAVCLLLAQIGVEPEIATEFLVEYLAALPTIPDAAEPYAPQMTDSFKGVWNLLTNKRNEYQLKSVNGIHILEAYARFATNDRRQSSDGECQLMLVLAQRHSQIALAVYNELPGA